MASTSFWARLVWGNRELRIDAEPFILGQSFSPPAVARNVSYTNGIRVKDEYIDRSWSFDARVMGANEEEVRGFISQLTAFVELARDKANKLYFEYYPHSAIGAIPLWGQGVYRYEIKNGICTVTSPWSVRDSMAFVQLTLTIAPYAEGIRQRLASGKGMVIFEPGPDPNSKRGVIMGNPTTNLIPNPIFSNLDWDNGWSALGSAVITQNTDPDYILFGDVSAKVSNTSLSAGTLVVAAGLGTAAITAGTYCLSCYIRKPGGGTFGTAETQLYAQGTALGVFNSISIGNDWYRIYDYATLGTAGSQKIGVNIYQPGQAFYMDGFQVEYMARGTVDTPSPLVFGDQMGATWNGTRGSATSVSTAGQLRIPIDIDTFNASSGCVRMAVKWNSDYYYGGTQYFYYAGTAAGASNYGYYNPADDKVYLYAGGTNISSGTQAFRTNDIAIYHFVWGSTLLQTKQVALYINGVEAANSNTFNVIDASGYIYVGCDWSGSAQLQATLLDYTVFDQYIDAAHVAADYAQVYEWVSGDGGRQLNAIPYLSTIDGDDVTDAYYDATHQDWAVAANIPGNLPAHTVFDMDAHLIAPYPDAGFIIANHAYESYLQKADEWFGTDVARTVGTAEISYPGTSICINRDMSAYSGRKVYIAATLTDGTAIVGGALYGRVAISQNYSSNVIYSEYNTITATKAHEEWQLIGPVMIPDTMPSEYNWMQSYRELNYGFQLKRSSGSGTITLDFYRIVVGDGILYLSTSGMNSQPTQSVIIDGMNAYSYFSGKENGFRTLYGDPIELEPGKYNHLTTLPLKISQDYDSGNHVHYNRVYVTPRYALL